MEQYSKMRREGVDASAFLQVHYSCMQLSDHYPSFPEKTLLVLTNNELARLFILLERDVAELSVIATPEYAPAATPASPGDLDRVKLHRREELYTALAKEMRRQVEHEDIVDIILCAPEANKNDITAALTPDILKRIKTVVPKNLASMELVQVLRILFES